MLFAALGETPFDFAPNLTASPDFVNANILSRIGGTKVHQVPVNIGIINIPLGAMPIGNTCLTVNPPSS